MGADSGVVFAVDVRKEDKIMNDKLMKLVPFLATGSVVGAQAQDEGVAVGSTTGETGYDVGGAVAGEYAAISARLNELAETPEGRETATTMLNWIDGVEVFHLPWVNWVLVAVGVALFGSHLGQLVLGKLWVGLRGGGWSLTESLNDALVAIFALLALPVVLMIPIGADTFVERPLAVISAVLVGVVLAFVLYFHGVRQERLAADGAEVLRQKKSAKKARASA